MDSARRALATAEAAVGAFDTAGSVDTTETRLENRGARSLPFGPGFAIAVGALLTGLGLVFAFGVSLVALFAPHELSRDQRWVIPPTLVFLILIGLGLICSGLADRRRAARGEERAAGHPEQPWFAEEPWDPQGTFAEPAGGGATGLLAILLFVFVMAPFNVLWLHVFDPHEDDLTRVLSLMVLIPDFFMFLLIRGVTSIVRDRVRFGRPRLRFELFPFFLNETLEVRVTAKEFAGQQGVVANLRCIEERTMASGSGRNRSLSVRLFQLYHSRRAFPGTFAGEDVPLLFDLPAQPTTELLLATPRYWELELRGGGTTAVRFTVPVYARPGIP